ncbi:MAG TPA: substrate-binding domain-containing protein [Bacteroidia bacterium]|nr:substrate-binding domain-containing protein [Bacteroidia bacterium]
MNSLRRTLVFIPVLFLLVQCETSSRPPEQELDTPTSGKVRFSIDENVAPLADELIDAFEYSYPDAFLVQSYGNEESVVNELFNDSSRLAFMTRKLNKEELSFFESKKFGIEQIPIGKDAVVFIVNRENPDSVFAVDEIRKMLTGEDSLWNEVDSRSSREKITVVFDNSASSNLRYLTDTLGTGKNLGKNCFAVSTNDSVIAYVQRTPGAVGVIGLNWLGDKDAGSDRERRSKICIAAIGPDRSSAVHPTQSDLVTGAYPFARGIWLVKIGKRADLGTGFASFAYSDRGQLIVQTAGLAPAAPAERKVEINLR